MGGRSLAVALHPSAEWRACVWYGQPPSPPTAASKTRRPLASDASMFSRALPFVSWSVDNRAPSPHHTPHRPYATALSS
jgi:hypothetical protein